MGIDVAPRLETDVRAAGSRVPNWMYIGLAAAAVLGYWLPRLFRGFWIDETLAYWIAHDGFAQTLRHAQACSGQSILYGYLVTLFAVDGPYKEALLRLPSVAGVLLGAWPLFKLTDRIAGSGSGFLAVVPFLCAGAIVETATDARPYALGLGVMLASFWSLREWVHAQSRQSFVVYCISSSLVIYFQYLFGMIFVVQAIYLVMARRAGRTFRWTQVLAAGVIVATAALPLVWQFLSIVHASSLWKSSSLPTLATFLAFYPIQVLCPAAVGLLLFRLLHREWFGRPRRIASDDLVLLLAWMLLGPVCMFVAGWATSTVLFSTRYLIYALPPVFILVAWAIRQVENGGARFALVLAIALNSALYVPFMRQGEWRTPLQAAQDAVDADTPLLLESGFVESARFDLRGEPKRSSYLFAPLLAYPIRNAVIPVPFFMDRAAEQNIEQAILERELRHRRFCLLAITGSDALATLPAWFKRHGYQTSARTEGSFTILVFERVT